MAGVLDVNHRRTGGKFFVDVEGRLLVLVVERNLRGLRLAAGGHGDVVEVDLDGVQRDRRRRLAELEIDGFIAVEGIVREIDVDGQRIMIGRRASGKALRDGCAASKQAGYTNKQDLFHSTLSGSEDYLVTDEGNYEWNR